MKVVHLVVLAYLQNHLNNRNQTPLPNHLNTANRNQSPLPYTMIITDTCRHTLQHFKPQRWNTQVTQMIHNVEYKVHIQHIIQLKIQNSGDDSLNHIPRCLYFWYVHLTLCCLSYVPCILLLIREVPESYPALCVTSLTVLTAHHNIYIYYLM